MTLEYSTRTFRRPFRFFLLFMPLVALSLMLAYYFSIFFFNRPYLGPPPWFRNLERGADVVAIAGVLSSLLVICVVPFRHRSIRQLLFVVFISVMCLFGVAFAYSLAKPELMMAYRHLPVQ